MLYIVSLQIDNNRLEGSIPDRLYKLSKLGASCASHWLHFADARCCCCCSRSCRLFRFSNTTQKSWISSSMSLCPPLVSMSGQLTSLGTCPSSSPCCSLFYGDFTLNCLSCGFFHPMLFPEWLDMSSNHFSGTLPETMKKLHSLSE